MATTVTTSQNFIGGEWLDAASGDTFDSTSPADGELIGTFPRSDAEDVDRDRPALALALVAAEARLRSIMQSVPDAMIIIDDHGRHPCRVEL